MLFKAASIFSSNMVLQRGKNINVFGTGTDGKEISISLTCGELSSSGKAVTKDGKWLVKLPPMEACIDAQLEIRCEDEFTKFTNIAIGEVWLAGGQSNMEYELRNCTGGASHLKDDKNVNVRYYYTQKKTLADEDFLGSESKMRWTEFSDKESAKSWSAVGYFFAKELSERLGVTVGIIGCNWGGTSASAWMKRKYCQGETSIYFDEYDRATAGKTTEELIADYRDYQAYHAAWEARSAEFYTKNPNGEWSDCIEFCGENKYPGPPSPANPMSPGVLHESMIERICPYTLAGVIYYQGESDDHRPEMYYTLMSQLIRNWREDWADDRLPFILAQLPMHRWRADADTKNWCVIRQAQMRIYDTIKNTGIAVLADCGEFNEIHPHDKVPVGHRFALQALQLVYGGCDGAFSPMFSSAKWGEKSVELAFRHASGGFDIKLNGSESDNLLGFEISQNGSEYRPVSQKEIYIEGNIISIMGDNITGVRYLWSNYADVKIYGKYGLPLAPFMAEY